jgi:hypothetical protein
MLTSRLFLACTVLGFFTSALAQHRAEPVLAVFLSAPSSAETDPFIGKWKLNPSKSKAADQMSIKVAGENRYTLTFGGVGESETVVADGSDQPGVLGTTISVTVESTDSWKIVRKRNNRPMLSAVWKLAKDGQTLTDAFMSYQADGTSSTVNMVYRRAAGDSGIPGTWETSNLKVDFVYEIEVRPYEGDGLSIAVIGAGAPKSLKFDGKEYPHGPNGTSSGRRIDDHSVEITEKTNGKVMQTQQMTVSQDQKSLTLVIHLVDQREPNVLVFDRE